MQAICALPPPANMICTIPGSLATGDYHVQRFFFSGHTASAVFGDGYPLAEIGSQAARLLVFFEVGHGPILRAH